MWRERKPLFWHQGGGGDCHLQQEKVARLALAFLPRGLRGRVSIKERSPSFYLPGEARRVHESALGHSWSHRLGTASCRGQEGGLELMPGWRAGYIGLYPVLWCTWCLLA